MKNQVAIIGYGALGKILTEVILTKLSEQYQIAGIWSRSIEKYKEELNALNVSCYSSLEELLNGSADYVVEIASVQAALSYGEQVLNARKHLILTSVGALADDEFSSRLKAASVHANKKVYVTSGAVGGFDIFRTIALMGNADAQIETWKSPASLVSAPGLQGKTLSDTEEETVFNGTAREAIAGFPKNVNVAVASASASVGVDHMKTIITSTPGKSTNTHKITVKNDSVTATLKVSSRPDARNPKSSVVTAWSVASLLANLSSPVEFY